MQIENHLIQNARLLFSPNFDERPGGLNDISLIVVHGISLPPEQFGGPYIDQLFTNSLNPQEHPFFATIVNLRVSSHVLIDRKGVLTQYVSFDKRAWHAGASSYRGRSTCNDFSIGIELEGSDNQNYENKQYKSLAQLIKALIESYPTLSTEHIVGHSDIAPGRKTDPGPYFEWAKLQSLL